MGTSKHVLPQVSTFTKPIPPVPPINWNRSAKEILDDVQTIQKLQEKVLEKITSLEPEDYTFESVSSMVSTADRRYCS